MHPALILVADADEPFREAVAWALRVRGFRVLSVGSGQQALWLASIHRIALLVVDAETPEIDGLTVLRRIREDPHGAGIPAILMSRVPLPVDGEFATLRKPLRTEDLVHVVEWMLGGSGRAVTPKPTLAFEAIADARSVHGSGDDPEPSSA